MNYINPHRHKVLQIFKNLHRTRQKVFSGDDKALVAGRIKINQEFKSKKHVTNENSIKELIELATNVEKELKEAVVQLQEIKPKVFVAKINPETRKLDNVPYKDVPEEELLKHSPRKKCKK